MLYLPRLYVYHVDAKKGSDKSETFKIMEYRLLKFIMNPAMIITWVAGGLMIYAAPGLMEQGWIHVKLTAVILMSAIHTIFARWLKVFAADQNTRSAKYYKIWNEIPTLLMVIIVILVITKPF